MKFVTVATHNDGYLKWLKESCKRYSANLVILGFGEKWQGYNWKFIKIALDNNIIYVSVPLKNSTFQYKTKFEDYYSAIKYTESKFYYFIDNENISF